jgi:hypothetical protein
MQSLLNHINIILGRRSCSRSLGTVLLRTPIIFHLRIQLFLCLFGSAVLRSSLSPTAATSLTPLSSRTRSSTVSSAWHGATGTAAFSRDVAVNVARSWTSDVGMADWGQGTRSSTRCKSNSVRQGARRGHRVEGVSAAC